MKIKKIKGGLFKASGVFKCRGIRYNIERIAETPEGAFCDWVKAVTKCLREEYKKEDKE